MDETYRSLFTVVLTLITGFIGVPIIQWIKNTFSLKDRAAVALAVFASLALAVIELLLTQQLDLAELTLENLPAMFFTIFGIATIYYQIFKGTKGLLGDKFMVRGSAKSKAEKAVQ